MSEDIKISLGVEADELMAGLRKAINQLESLILTANKTESAVAQIDDQKIDLDTTQAQGELDNLGKKANDVADEGIDKAGFWGATLGGALGTVAGMGIQAAVSGVQMLGQKIMDGALAADEFGDTMEVAFAQQGIGDIEGEMEKVRASTLNLANDLGLPVQRTRELASTVATMGGVSGKQAEELTKLSAGLEVFSGGAVKGEAVALAFSKGLADPEGAAAIERLAKKYPQLAETLRSNIDPAEKMKVANELLGESFKTVADQQGDAGGQLNKLSNIANEAFETIGSGVYDAIGPLLTGLMPALTDGIPKAMNFLVNIFNEAKDIITSAFAGAGGPAVDFGGIISGVADILKTTFLAGLENLMGLLRMVWNLAVYAFEQISDAIKPLIDRMGGLEGITNGVKEVFKFLYSILEPIGKFLIDVLAYALGLVVSWFSKLWDAGMAVYNFFANLDAIGRGVGAMFNSLVGTLGEVWRAITSFNWDDIGNIMANGFTNAKKAYDDAYNSSKKTGEQQRAEVKKTEEAIVKSNEVVNKSNLNLKPPGGPKPPKGDKPKADKPKDEDSEFEALKKQYEKEEQLLQQRFDREQILAEKNGEDLKALAQRQEGERSRLLNTFLNDRLAKVKDANQVLSNEEITSIIKPSEKKGETAEDVIEFYLSEIKKNQKGLVAEAKLKAEVEVASMKSVSKDWSDSVKVFESTMQNIVPKALATTQDSLKQTIEQVKTFIGFLQLQSIEIQNLFTKATLGGQTETAKALEDSLVKVNEYIGTLQTRLSAYEKQSLESMKKAESEKDIVLQSSLAIKGAMQEAFDFKAYKKEKEETQKRLEEQRKGFAQEEKDLQKSFAKREITFDAYAKQLGDINKKRQDAEEIEQKTFLDRLKGAGDKAASTIFAKSGDIFKKMAKDMKDGEKVMFESFAKLAGKFGELAATGKATLKDFASATIDIAVNAMLEMIPIWTAQIFGTSVAQLGIGGLAVAAALQATLIGLVFAARSSAGFKDGVVNLQGEGTETSDSIPAWLSKGESVITARATRMNKEELEWINKTGKSVSEYYAEKHSLSYINDKGILQLNNTISNTKVNAFDEKLTTVERLAMFTLQQTKLALRMQEETYSTASQTSTTTTTKADTKNSSAEKVMTKIIDFFSDKVQTTSSTVRLFALSEMISKADKYFDFVSTTQLSDTMEQHIKKNTAVLNDVITNEVNRRKEKIFESVTHRTASAIFDSEVIEELKLLRKDTQALGKSISHKTTVDVQGELRVDSKHITALVETNRRKLSRRG